MERGLNQENGGNGSGRLIILCFGKVTMIEVSVSLLLCLHCIAWATGRDTAAERHSPDADGQTDNKAKAVENLVYAEMS